MRTFKMYFFSMWSRHIVLLCTIPNAHAPLNGHSCALSRFLRDKKKTINVEDAAILEHLLKPKGCKTFTFHPMMINTLGKVPVYSFDVCDHIPS